MSEPSLESNEELIQSDDELITEFIEENKHQMVDPDQYPAMFQFMVKSFLYRKGLLNE